MTAIIDMIEFDISRKITVRKDEWCKESPNVNDNTQPRARDFHPDTRRIRVKRLQVIAWCVPIGEGHHNVESRQHEHEMEHRVAVSHTLFLVVVNVLTLSFFILTRSDIIRQDRIFT